MIRYMKFLLWHPQYFKSIDGVRHFGELSVAWFISEVTSLANKLTKANDDLAIKREACEKELDELRLLPTVSHNDYIPIKRKLIVNEVFLFLISISETFFTLIVVQIFMGRIENPLDGLLKTILAFILTLPMIGILERCLTEVMRLISKENKDEQGSYARLTFFLILSIAIEALSYFYAQERAKDFESGGTTQTGAIALTLTSMILPLLGAVFAHEITKHFGPYWNAKSIKKLKIKIQDINKSLNKNEKDLENELKESINTRWGILDEFKLYKFNRDRKRGIELEQLRGHFSENRDSFSKKCQEEFGRKVAQLLPPTTSVKFIPQFTQTELTENFNGSTINI